VGSSQHVISPAFIYRQKAPPPINVLVFALNCVGRIMQKLWIKISRAMKSLQSKFKTSPLSVK